jgi:hypothetical protein
MDSSHPMNRHSEACERLLNAAGQGEGRLR